MDAQVADCPTEGHEWEAVISFREGGNVVPLTLSWKDIALRLVLSVIAGSLIGINRSEGGHAAGLRTTWLVCLAASVAMIQMNLLMSVRGKTPESFAVLDLMRLPLGILTGMGFIGGGAILKRGDMVHGVTTAATLWLVTVIGLCLGGGQLGLGITATALALFILGVLKWLEVNLSQVRHACSKSSWNKADPLTTTSARRCKRQTSSSIPGASRPNRPRTPRSQSPLPNNVARPFRRHADSHGHRANRQLRRQGVAWKV